MCAASAPGAAPGCSGAAPEPLIRVVPTIVATMKIAAVARLSRWSVSQGGRWAWSQLRAPEAPAIAANAHPAHMGPG